MLFFAVLLEYNLLNTPLAKTQACALPSQEGKEPNYGFRI
jgi:hypothetical protein